MKKLFTNTGLASHLMKIATILMLISLISCAHTNINTATNPMDYGLRKNLQDEANNYTTLETKYYTSGTAAQQNLRDQIVYDRIQLIDEYQRIFESDLTGRAAGIDTVSDIVAGALGLASGAGPQGQTSRILTAMATGTVLGKNSAQKNFLQNQGASLLVAKMEVLRAAKKADIMTKMKNDVTEYSLGQALSDVDDYAYCGSITAASTAISADTATTPPPPSSPAPPPASTPAPN